MKTLSKRYGTVGWQEFLRQKKDILNAYDSAKESGRNRPTQTEHGNVAEASFRKWLSEYLPKKYGVTSGFIIPDVRSASYKLKHYDVIVYDALSSPVLWASNSPDSSEQGRSRAIPAVFVHAVIEVKSAFTRSSVADALNKLRELNDFAAYLHPDFTSNIVFFELREEDQKTSRMVQETYVPDVHGYFGGLILRAEGYDEDVAGYYQVHHDHSSDDEPVEIPLIRKLGVINKHDNGDVIVPPGEAVYIVSEKGSFHVDPIYMVTTKNAMLKWSYNSLPIFAADLTERLQGTFRPTSEPRPAYGMSFLGE